MTDAEGESARSYIEKQFFNPKKYDLGEVGRYKINRKLELDIDTSTTILTLEELKKIIEYIRELWTEKKKSMILTI